MAKVTVEYNMPEDREAFELYVRAPEYSCAIHEIREALYKVNKLSDGVDRAKWLEDKLTEIFNERNLWEG